MMASGSPPPHQQEHHHERPPPSLDPHLLHGSVASSGAGVVAGGGGTKGGCGRCGQAFSIFFNKRVQCGGGCGLPVCRKCAPWSTAAQTYVCGVCSTQQPQSTTHAATTTPKTPDDAHLRQVEDSVRSHIEALVESQVGGPLDQVTAAPSTTQPHPARLDLDKISENSKWDLLLYYYCFCHEDQEEGGVAAASTSAVSPSAAAAAAAAAAAFLSPMGDRPLPTEDLPTSRHTQLSDQLTHAIKDAMILPRQMEGYDPAVSPETPVEDFNSHTYEDILATAILNKVLESCEGGRPNEVTIEVSHDVTSTDTDSGMSGGAKESRRGRHKRSEVSEAGSEGSEERSLTPPRHPAHRPTTISPDQGVVTDDCWANAVTTEGAPLQFKIEEHVEEITTHHLTDDDQDLEGIYDEDVSDSGGSWRGSRCSLDDSRERRHHKVSHHSVTEDPLLSTINVALPDPAHITSRRVSFPELGADIIHDSYADADECEAGPGDMVVDSETWEENWLFRRQRLVGAAGSDPVTMLIPNPEAHVPATVGNRDVDELSELSEQQSFGSGEPWSDSEGEGEAGESYQPSTASRELSTLAGEIVAEFAQQDQEYTVDYSVPSRVTTASTTQQGGGRKHSPTQPSPTQSHKSSTMPQSVHYLYTSHKEVPTGYHDGKTVEGIRNPVIVGKPRVDPDTISDSERPVPKPRKLSLATTPPSKTSMKSPLQLLPSPAEDLTILSPPLDMPHPKNVSSTSETVWFVETPEDYTVMQGRTLRLACQVNTKKPMGLSWYHNGSLVPVNHRDYWVFRRGSHHHLHVYGMTPSAAGVYAAAAYTTTHCVWVFCRVQHKANSRPQKRPTFTKGLSDITLEEGGELNLQCQVQGHPEPRVIFSRGLVKLEPSSRLAVESDQYGTWTLRLAECTLADSGEITATAFNMMSTITTRCHVRIVPEGTPIPQQDRTDTGRLKPSSSQVNKQQDPRPGGRHNRKKHNPGSYPSNTTRPTSGNLLTSAKTSSLPHRDQLTTSSGVNTDVDDLDDIQQVPTRPGITQEDVFSSTYGPTVDNEHVLSHDQTTVDEDSDLNSSVLLDGGRAYKCKVLGMDKSLEPIEYGETIDNSTTDGGNSADAYAPLFKDASASLEYLAEDISNPSSSLCEEFPNLASNGLISPSSSPCGASLGLDYYPSSHDDNPSDKEELPVIMSSVLSYSSSSTAIDQRVNIDPSVNISPLFPLTTDQLHAYTTLRDQHQEHEECPQGDKHDPACLLTASRPPTGTIADREHRKWEAAVSLPNNPYAPERLVQRLSLCHTSDHTPQPRRTLSVEFPEEGEKEEVDPSLRDGVPPKTDLNRYSRDYYVTPATGVRASSKNFKHQKSQQQQHQEPQAHQQKKQHQQQQQPGHQQQSYKTHQHLTLNGHQAVTRTSSDFSSNAQIHIIGGGLQNTNKSNSEATLHCLRKAEVESSRPSDWKDELRDIQAAHVEQEVAKFQQTIDETQRRWEENYARVVPRSTHTNGQSDSSTEVLHNPRVDAYLVPPRHDLWRTVSEDTIAAQPRDRTVLQPFLRHTSVDNLQPSTKVSNLRNLGSLPQQNMNSMNSVSSMSNININSVTGLGKSANYQHQTHYNRSMESMSTYSDGESQGEGIDSDASTRTPDEMPVLPSVRKLACKFDQASQERVNDLDKRGKDNALSYYGKKNILLIEKSTFSDQPYTRSFTNNLNKRTEKPYIVKEVHSLTARSVPRQFREGLRNSHTISQDLSSKPPSHHSSHSPRRDAPSPEHLGIPWGPAAIPIRPTQIHGDTSDDSSATSGSPRRVPRRRSGGRRDHPGWYARPECGSLTDPATHAAADSFC
ncbi:uncharacterized protein LOC121865492 isoform X2 [Homarus americanus]|uniref:uncharacterized protein LOC121865492 isoform X2 n=1 Tax=Homarus americanus TaxID=6706 RepID=UPI001C4715D8|nr:uncharacterized protein LOC121865492 isoform X2 [Homarus americanus]